MEAAQLNVEILRRSAAEDDAAVLLAGEHDRAVAMATEANARMEYSFIFATRLRVPAVRPRT